MIVLAAAQEVGGANALIPVIGELVRSGDAQVRVLACDPAATAFSNAGLKIKVVSPPNGHFSEYCAEISRRVEEINPGVLLLGTAWGPSLDKALLKAVGDNGLPSVSVIDMWSNYRERFLDADTDELRLPSKVALMDQTAFLDAVETGLPEGNLAVTGQPYLESIKEKMADPEVASRGQVLRRRWLSGSEGPNEQKVVLFASEGIAKDFGPATPYYRGYTEVEALAGLLEAANQAERTTGQSIKIAVKLHPSQPNNSLDWIGDGQSRSVVTVADEAPRPCIKAADVVVGMTSMFLLESAFAGLPTISFQPGGGLEDPFFATRLGMLDQASSVQELTALLERYCSEDLAVSGAMGSDLGQSPYTAHQGAAKRIAELTLELASSGPVQASGVAS